jgi:hypothetical protein
LQVTIRAGDVLYIPRGVPHEAETVDSESIHLSIGVTCAKWKDLDGEALGETDERRSARIADIRSRRWPFLKDVPLRALADFERRLATLRRHYIASLPARSLATALTDTTPISKNARLTRIADAYSVLHEDPESGACQFQVANFVCSVPPRLRAAFHRISMAASISVEELAEMVGHTQALEIGRALASTGLYVGLPVEEDSGCAFFTT